MGGMKRVLGRKEGGNGSKIEELRENRGFFGITVEDRLGKVRFWDRNGSV